MRKECEICLHRYIGYDGLPFAEFSSKLSLYRTIRGGRTNRDSLICVLNWICPDRRSRCSKNTALIDRYIHRHEEPIIGCTLEQLIQRSLPNNVEPVAGNILTHNPAHILQIHPSARDVVCDPTFVDATAFPETVVGRFGFPIDERSLLECC